MGSEQYSNSLLQAMSIIANKAVSDASFNKTIQAVIVECKDATIEKYRVRYQDGFWEAYGNGSGVTYLPGTSVYILVPNGDMSQPKTIIGTVQKLGINYINTISEQNQYYENGNNTLVNNITQFELCSYQTQTIQIYNRNKKENKVNINEEETAFYLQTSSHLKCSFNIKTSLDLHQRFNGNYGIRFYLTFLDRAKEEEVIRQYTFDTYLMSGNPYLFTNKVPQSTVFEIDGANFLNIDRIELFTEGFPKQAEGHPADIFISNLAIVGVNQLSEQEMNGVSLSFVAKKGYIFNDTSSDNDTREIQAIVRVLGKTVNDTISQKLSFYWFVQNISISKSSPFYNKYGGYGWKCLNPYKILERDEYGNITLVDFNSMGSIFTIAKEDVQIKQQKYKCVVLYGNESFSKEFTIINHSASYEIQIESDKGIQFVLDSGYPNLKCILKHKGKEVLVYNNYIFHWGVINNKGVFSSLPQTDRLYQVWHEAEERVNNLQKLFEDNQIIKNGTYKNQNGQVVTNEEAYNEAKDILQKYRNTEIIHSNYIYHVNIKKIINFSTFVCTVSDINSNVIGSKEITLINDLTSNGGYSLIINNGKQSFNYNEQGISPCKNEKINYVIPELSFTLLNEKGQEVDQNEIKPDNIKWVFPDKNNSLLIHRERENEQRIPQTDYTIIYPKARVFTYEISDKYFSNKNDNDIELRVTYNGYTLTAKTDFLFSKQGFLGTNGTGTVLRIIPLLNGNPIDELPYFKIDKNKNDDNIVCNFNELKAQLYENGQQVFAENESSYIWSILKSKKEDFSNLKLKTPSLGQRMSVSFINTPIVKQEGSSIYNIVKVSVLYNDNKIYATLPIIVYEICSTGYDEDIYDLKLVPNTGFQYVFYAEDGTRPQYDNKNPFTFKLTETSAERTNGREQDITKIQLPDFEHSFEYQVKGNLTIRKNSDDSNICDLVPNTTYDGSSLDNYLICRVNKIKQGEFPTTVAQCLIPIHMMLNRYGHAALNDWDGNSIDIGNSSGDTILAPQVGAGQKNNKNEFTGILMGSVKTSNQIQNGLFGYSDGKRTIFLDAETGNANFGLAGNGQIKIDATKSTITGGGYDDANSQTGMLIDLKTPEIKFKTGNFSVNKNGYLIAQGGGRIAGWNIKDNELSKDTVGMSSNNKDSKDQTKINNNNIAFWAGDTKPSDAPFSVNFKGDLKSTSIDVGGNVHIKNGKIYSGEHNTLNSTKKGFYLDHTGLSIGGNFKVSYDKDNNSLLTVQKGYIGNSTSGFTIDNNVIYNGKEKFNSTNNGIYLGKNGISLGAYNEKLKTNPFSVNNAGYLTATSGKLAGWNFNDEALYNGVSIAAYDDGKGGVYTKGIYFGPGGLRMGKNFHVNSAGSLYCIDGSIGGWEIKAGSLTGGSLKLYSTGAINDSGDTWHIAANGEATFRNVKTANIHGGTISGGNRTGGSITGGSISPGGVGCGNYDNMNSWCENIVATKITADYIQSKISSMEILSAKTISAQKILVGKRRGIEVATQTWAAQMVNDKLKDYAKTSDIPTSVTIDGKTYKLNK